MPQKLTLGFLKIQINYGQSVVCYSSDVIFGVFLFCMTSSKTKQNALECLNRLLDSLDKMIILEEVLPFLTEIQCSDVDIIMAVIGQ